MGWMSVVGGVLGAAVGAPHVGAIIGSGVEAGIQSRKAAKRARKAQMKAQHAAAAANVNPANCPFQVQSQPQQLQGLPSMQDQVVQALLLALAAKR